MYISPGTDGYEADALRQGDIISGVPFPLLAANHIKVLSDPVPNADGTLGVTPTKFVNPREDEWTIAQVPVRFCICIVLSNCCDLELRGGKVPAYYINLARLREIPSDTRKNTVNFASLQANRDPRDPNSPGYIDYFYLQEDPALRNVDWRVHFNQVVSIPNSEVQFLLQRKILQLNDRTRMRFKIKLAFTTGRSNSDEIKAGLENPWIEPTADNPREAEMPEDTQPPHA